MGTMLQKKGMAPGTVPEQLNFTRPEWIKSIHRAYLDAGSQIIYANTFGANRRKLSRTDRTCAEVISAAVKLAKEAAQGTDALVGLDVGPIGELLEPMGTLTFEAAYDIFAEMMEAGAKAGADLVAIETMTDLYETKAALLAAKENTALPVFVTMSFEASGRTFTGCTAASMAHTLEGLGADAIGVNCSLGPKELLPLVQELRRHTTLPLIAKPNAGLPDPEDGRYDLPPEEFAAAMTELIQAGAALVGGCCGTDERYIQALKAVLPEKAPFIAVSPPPLICTPTAAVALDRVRVIGERVNPTGKKRFQQALLENDLDYIVSVAVQEMDAGADILDVNVGFPGVDEKTMLPRTVKAIQAAVDLPLQLDSVDPAALEAALRVYNGKAAVNSVSGKDESMDAILPIVKKYGAAVVGLTLDETGLPDTAEKRFAIAEKILNRALAFGIPRQDVWIDCLTLTVSAQQEQAEETLKAVHQVRAELGLQTVLGVSNISFGLPNRPLITQAFLIRALHAGLTLPIVNPNQREMMDAVAAFKVLNGEDAQCAGYIARFAQAQPETKAVPSPASMTIEEAILRGLKSDAGRLAKEALKTEAPLNLVEQRLIPALDKVGLDYEKGVVFLPQLLSAAQAAQAVFEEIKESLSVQGAEQVIKGKLILATVQGDIHDIGKNIVKTVLQNYGYAVIDLGRDVAPETIVETTVSQNVPLVGLSALMTTTLPAMAETVRLLKLLPNPPFVMVGGAVVTPEYAQAIGADGYAKDARGAASIVRKAFEEKK
ncbi:MAG: homocysteine S-methyltransferase family protein [Clostridia bacterium]|nr:homocysteine S-methyltransferase family protein [Clostridia bacterium]